MKFAGRSLSIVALVVSGLVAIAQLSTAQTSGNGSSAVPAYYAGQTKVVALGTVQANPKLQPPLGAAVAQFSQVYDGLPRNPATPANVPRFVPSGQRHSTHQVSNTQPVVAAPEHANEDTVQADARRNNNEDDDDGEDADGEDNGDEEADDQDEDEDDEDEDDEDDDDDDENENELQESITALDHLLESSTVKRILGLMAENLQLRAEMRVQQMESKFQLQLMELKLDQALEPLECAEDERMHMERRQDEDRQLDEREQDEREQVEREQAEMEQRNAELQQRSKNLEQAKREQQKMAAQMQQQRQLAEMAHAEMRAALKESEEHRAQLQQRVDQLLQQLEQVEQRAAKNQ